VIKTLVAPILGFLSMAGACYLLIANRAVLSGAGSALFIKLVPYTVVVMFLIGVVLALVLRARSRETYSAIGRFVREEEVVA